MKSVSLEGYKIDYQNNSISSPKGERVLLQPKFLQVLNLLIDAFPEPVSREQLIDNVWDGNFLVGDKSLNNAIWNLRNSLPSSRSTPLIKTIRGKGYALTISPEKPVEQNLHPDKISQNNSTLTSTLKNPLIYLLSVVFLIFLLNSKFLGWQKSRQSLNSTIPYSVETNIPGQEYYPVVSDDDQYLAFIGKFDGKQNIFLKDRSKTPNIITQLSFNDTPKTNLTWPSRSDHLFFLSFDSEKKDCWISKLNIESKIVSKILKCHDQATTYFNISPDLKTLIYRDISPSDLRPGLFIVDLFSNKKSRARLSCKNCSFSDKDVAFSPDGKLLAFTRRHHKLSEDIYLYNLETKVELQLTTNESNILGMDWQKDSKTIVFSSRRKGTYLTTILDTDSLDKKTLNLPGTMQPSLSNKNLFLEWHNANDFVAYVDLNTNLKFAKPLLKASYSMRYPDYSSIGDSLVYVSNESGSSELWQYSFKSKQRKMLTQLGESILFPKWSHDGKFIAFLMNTPDLTKNAIYMLEVATGKLNILNSPFSSHNRPTWSKDDKSILIAAIQNGKSYPFRISIENGKVEQVSRQQARHIQTDTNGQIFFTLHRKLPLRMFKEVEDNSETYEKEISPLNTKYNWTVSSDGRFVFYLAREADRFTLNKLDLTTNTNVQILALPEGSVYPYGSLSFIEEKNWIVFNARASAEVDIISVALNDL